MEYARSIGVPLITTDYRRLYDIPNLDLVIELTGSTDIRDEIERTRPRTVRLIDHFGARLFWGLHQGYGDLSCYGQQKFTTPNIDRLAREGMLFRQHYTGCTVSAPSRSSLMTGMHTGHTPVRGNKNWKPEGNWPLKGEAVTIAEILKSQGYITGAFGKWGLGYIGTEGDPNNQGFDEFYGFNCQTLAHNYYPGHLWHNNEKIILHENDSGKSSSYAPDLIHKAAMKFLENNSKKPFFLSLIFRLFLRHVKGQLR